MCPSNCQDGFRSQRVRYSINGGRSLSGPAPVLVTPSTWCAARHRGRRHHEPHQWGVRPIIHGVHPRRSARDLAIADRQGPPGRIPVLARVLFVRYLGPPPPFQGLLRPHGCPRTIDTGVQDADGRPAGIDLQHPGHRGHSGRGIAVAPVPSVPSVPSRHPVSPGSPWSPCGSLSGRERVMPGDQGQREPTKRQSDRDDRDDRHPSTFSLSRPNIDRWAVAAPKSRSESGTPGANLSMAVATSAHR